MQSEIYWNARKKCYSLRQNRKVVAHVEAFVMVDCELPVSVKARDRIRATGRKEVHAVIRGRLSHYRTTDGAMVRDIRVVVPAIGTNERTIAYNPLRDPRFVDVESRDPVSRAGIVGGRLVGDRPLVRCWDAP